MQAERRRAGRRRPRRRFSLARMLMLRHLDRGQTSVEHIGMIVVVVAIVGSLVTTGVTTELGQTVTGKICSAFGAQCGNAGNGGAQDPQADGPAGDADGDGVPDVDAAKSPEELEYEAAVKEYQDAQADVNSDSEAAKEAAEELAKILADELGITDALDCLTKGDGGACANTVINVLLNLVGGAAAKLLAKYGAPWKWKEGAELVGRLRRLGGTLYDSLRNLIRNRKRLDDADDRLKRAKEACDHSFLPGTAVLLADGRRVPIEAVRTGDVVVVTDPKRGRTTTRPVAGTITTERDKDFTRLTVRVGGRDVSLTATDTHPFWLADKQRWADAGDIRPGSRLRTPSGGTLPVVAVSKYEKQQRTHDLSIEGIHTYYVEFGTGAGTRTGSGPAALVHNCPKKNPNSKKKPTPPQPKEVDATVKKIEDGTHPQRLNPDGTPDVFEGRPGTPPAVARKWAGSKIYEVPGKGNNYRILVNKYGDVGYTDNHYGRILPYKPPSAG